MIKQDTLEKQAKFAFIAIGSNKGNKKLNIELAKFKLENNSIKIIKSSSNYETLSWPDPSKPKFINIVIKVKTTLSVKKLLYICQKIEFELGRKRSKKNEPRTCDIDIIDYNGQVIEFTFNNSIFTVPHSKLTYRNFVLFPLQEIAPNWKHPKSNDSIGDLIKKLPIDDKKSILKIGKP